MYFLALQQKGPVIWEGQTSWKDQTVALWAITGQDFMEQQVSSFPISTVFTRHLAVCKHPYGNPSFRGS